MNTETQVLPDAFLRMQAVQQPQCAQEIMGIAFTRIDLEGVVRAVMDRDPNAPFAYVATPNAVHVVGVDRQDPLFVSGLQGAWIRTCDSRIVRRLACRMFATDLPLATGSDLTARLFEREIVPGDTVTLVGGTDEMVRRLGERFGVSGIRHYVPPMGFIHRPAEIRDCIRFIEDNPSRFVFIACGAPQSEFLAQCVVRSGGATGVGLCVGASLLFVTGMLKRAPKGWQKLGLEWLYRLTQEPSRLWKRLFVSQLPVLWVALKHRLSAR